MAKLKSILLTVENVALGDVLDKLDGMPGIINIDLKLNSQTALVPAEGGKRPPGFGKTVEGVSVQEAVLRYLAANGPTHVAVLSKHIGEKNNTRIYSCTYNLKQKGEIQLVSSGTYQITTLGRKRLPLELQASPKPKALPKPSNGSVQRPPRGASHGILLKALADGTKKIAELGLALEAGGLSKNSISGRLRAAQEAGIIKSSAPGEFMLTTKGVKEADALKTGA